MKDKKTFKNILRIVIFTLLVLYSTLYVTQALGYYEYSNSKTNALTTEAIERFEKDIKEGKSIKASDYIKKENDYNNKLSKSGLAISNVIEGVFDKVMGFIFNEINKAVND